MPANKSTLLHSTPSKENNNKLNGGSVTNGNGCRKNHRKQHHRKQHRHHHHLLHSEYRSTYTWHEFTGPSAQEQHTVVRRAPQPPSKSLFRDASAMMLQSSSLAKPHEDVVVNGEDTNSSHLISDRSFSHSRTITNSRTSGTCMEPPLPRRKKCPELAYRHHEFIPTAPAPVHDAVDGVDSNVVDNRVKEHQQAISRSRGAGRATQLMSKAISRISTEYRLQFAWPGRRPQTTTNEQKQQHLTNGGVDVQQQQQNEHQQQQREATQQTAESQLQQQQRKATVGGALRQSSIMAAVPAAVHKRRPPAAEHRRPGRDGGQASELEPLVQQDNADEHDDAAVIDRQPQQRSVRIAEPDSNRDNKLRPFSAAEVMELRRELKKLADEYKHRDWGGLLAQEDEASLWKRVSTNHALDALSLARSATKEEKDKENTRKVVPAPTIPTAQQLPAGRPSSVQARPFFQQDDFKADNENHQRMGRARRDFLIRHHLERTTGADDGALLVSPTREKLEPVIPRRRDESSAEPTPRSKSSPKSSPRAARSQSVGPGIDRRSPKRSQTRPASGLAKDAKDGGGPERQQRPSKVGQLTRPASSRWKTQEQQRPSTAHQSNGKSRPRSVSACRRAPKALISNEPSLAMTNAPPHRPAHARLQNQNQNNATNKSSSSSASRPRSLLHQPTAASAAKTTSKQAMTAEPQVNGVQSQPAAPPAPQPQPWIDDEPVVKSPPEPTRVKSPEQMIMRSPEPVNWTVPLDTGKTFTVTQNVREGEPPTRAHSEARSWGGPASQKQQSAEHKLQLQQQQQQQQQQSGYKSPESESVSLGSFSGTNGHKDDSIGPERTASPLATIAKDEVEQPAAFEAKKDDLLDKARDRFDKFWGSKGPEQ